MAFLNSFFKINIQIWKNFVSLSQKEGEEYKIKKLQADFNTNIEAVFNKFLKP